MSEERLLTIKQVCERLTIGRYKYYELVKKAGLPVIYFGRSVRIDPEALTDWIHQQRGKSHGRPQERLHQTR